MDEIWIFPHYYCDEEHENLTRELQKLERE